MVETGVIHGRFQILHNDHMKYLMAGKSCCQNLVVGITNPDPTLTCDDKTAPGRSNPSANPMSYYERYIIIKTTLLEYGFGIQEFSVVPLPINLPDLYKYYVPLDATFFLTIYDEWGEKKLSMFESMNLKTKILWRRPLSKKGLSGIQIRQYIASGQPWEHLVPHTSARIMKQMGIVERIKRLMYRLSDK